MKYLRIVGIGLGLAVVGLGSIATNSACAESRGERAPEKGQVKKEKGREVTDKGQVTKAASQDDLKSEVRNLSGFDGVSIGGSITATVTAGQNYEVVVAAKQEVLPKVITKIKGNTLHVEFEKNWWKGMKKKYKRTNVRVTISLPELKDLDVSGASKATVAGLNNERLTIDVSGASDVSIEGTAREINIDLSGASNLKAENLHSEVAEMDLSGASSAKVNVSGKLNVDASGASSVRYIGDPNVTKDTSGASSVSRN